MSEKESIEQGTAEEFLRAYKSHTGEDFVIIEHSDSPDFRCRNTKTGDLLDLEITLLEDVHGDAKYRLRRGDRPGVRRFDNDTVNRFKERIADKCGKDYGPHAALVLRQVAPLWTIADWDMYRCDFQAVIPDRCKIAFRKGIWILTWRDSLVLNERDIVQLA